MTELTNEELVYAFGRANAWPSEPAKSAEISAELLRRLGAAGSASPNWPEPSKRNLEAAKAHVRDMFPEFQGDELEALARSHIAFATGSASPQVDFVLGLRSALEVVKGGQNIAAISRLIKEIPSGSVSTHGPRPVCPNALTEENLAALEELEVSGWLNEWTGMELVHVHQGLERLLKEVRFHRAQFFAAAPAEDTKEPRVLKQRPDRPIGVEHYAIYESGDWLLPLKDFLDKYDEDWLKIFKAEDVQLDVEVEKRIAEIRERADKGVEYEDHADTVADFQFLLEQLALLRRVSGKGAQQGERPEICPACGTPKSYFENDAPKMEGING